MKTYRRSSKWVSGLVKEMFNKTLDTGELAEIIYKLDKSAVGDKAIKVLNPNVLRIVKKALSNVMSDSLVINQCGVGGGRNTFTINGNLDELLGRVEVYYRLNKKACKSPRYKKSVRDAIVNKAKALEEQNGELSREQSIKMARRSVRMISEEDIKRVWKMLILANNLGQVIEFSVLKIQLMLKDPAGTGQIKTLIGRVQPYLGEVKLEVQLLSSNNDGRSKLIKFIGNIPMCLAKLATLAEDLYGINLGPVKRIEVRRIGSKAVCSRPEFEDLNGILFFIGGIIMHESGKCATITKIGRILRGNYYHKVTQSDQSLLSIIQGFPQFFEVMSDMVRLAGKAVDTWDKLKLFNPAVQEWDIPWCVNSGLDIEVIREYFPESYIVNETANIPGSKIVMIKANKGIKSYNDLCLMSRRMSKGCDYPIVKDVTDFMMRLDAEYERVRRSLDSYMKGLTLATGRFSVVTEDFDRILYRLETEEL